MTETELLLKYLDELDNNEMGALFKLSKEKRKSDNEIFNQASRLKHVTTLRTMVKIFGSNLSELLKERE